MNKANASKISGVNFLVQLNHGVNTTIPKVLIVIGEVFIVVGEDIEYKVCNKNDMMVFETMVALILFRSFTISTMYLYFYI